MEYELLAGIRPSRLVTSSAQDGVVLDCKLERKLDSLAKKVARIEAVADFLVKHPAIASRTTLKPMSTGTGLYFEDKAYIRPVGNGPVALQLERHIEDWESSDESAGRIVHADVSALSAQQLAEVLKKVRIDLSKPDVEDDDEDEDK